MRFATPPRVCLLALAPSVVAFAGGIATAEESEPIIPPMESILADTSPVTPVAPEPGDETIAEEEESDEDG